MNQSILNKSLASCLDDGTSPHMNRLAADKAAGMAELNNGKKVKSLKGDARLSAKQSRDAKEIRNNRQHPSIYTTYIWSEVPDVCQHRFTFGFFAYACSLMKLSHAAA